MLEVMFVSGSFKFLANVDTFRLDESKGVYVISFTNKRAAYILKEQVAMIGWKEDLQK